MGKNVEWRKSDRCRGIWQGKRRSENNRDKGKKEQKGKCRREERNEGENELKKILNEIKMKRRKKKGNKDEVTRINRKKKLEKYIKIYFRSKTKWTIEKRLSENERQWKRIK